MAEERPLNLGPILLTFSFFYIVFQSSESCITGLKTSGVTYPFGDIYIEYGNPLEIFCILNDDYVMQHGNESSRTIMFTKNNETVPEEWVSIVNQSTIRLYVAKPPKSQDMYYCKEKETSTAVCLNTVVVGTKPIEVDDFSCISRNYENLTCNWTVPKTDVKIIYSLTYRFPGRNSRTLYKCPSMEPKDPVASGKVGCFWNLASDPQYRQSQLQYYFTLNMTNNFGSNVQKFNFSHFAHVVPAPPYNLTVLNKTSNSIYLHWSISIPLKNFPPGLVMRVMYASEYDPDDSFTVANTSEINLESKNKTFYFNLTDLQYAHTLYDIRVQMRSARANEFDEKMWSGNASVTVRTMSKLPDAPPRTNVGSFEIVEGGSPQLQSRDIYVYWQSIDEHMKNGENGTYKVISVEENGQRVDILPVEITNSYAKFKGLSLKDYKFNIVSSNEIGVSKEVSMVYVPALTNRVREPTSFTKIAFGEGTYELSWREPDVQPGDPPIHSYTIFWCKNGRDRPYQCVGYLQWIEVPFNTTIHNITVPEDEIFQFAISANTLTASSGMIWASCTVIHNRGIQKMKNLWIDHIGSTFMEVNWKLDCADRFGNPIGFKIFYCPIVSPVDPTCKGKEEEQTVTGDMDFGKGNVTGLKPYTTYMLTVSVITLHKGNGLQSDRLFNTTLEAIPDTPPLSVSVENVTNSSMVVIWTPPEAMNGVLRYYEIEYLNISDNHLFHRKVDLGEIAAVTSGDSGNITELSAVINNLVSYTEYEVRVRACTVACSQPSMPVRRKTAVSQPGIMQIPIVRFLNVSLVNVTWIPPAFKGGKLDMYQLRFKEKTPSGNTTRHINTTDLWTVVPNCPVDDESPKTYYFSIRAINEDEDRRYPSQWSSEQEYYCQSSSTFLYWVLLCLAILVAFFIIILFFAKKLYEHCQMMSDVEVKLPGGLECTVPHELNQWPSSNPKNQNDDIIHRRAITPADEELLLDKKKDLNDSVTGISGDSSGCSSGQESVISSVSGTNLSTDSGTEQPKTHCADNISPEKTLRYRKTGSEPSWNSEISWQNKQGYITMPGLDKVGAMPTTGWPANKKVGSNNSNYCVLGVDSSPVARAPRVSTPNNADVGYVPVLKNVNTDYTKDNYVKTIPFACENELRKPDATSTQSPYVIAVDPSTLASRDKASTFTENPPYSSVLPTNKLINIDSGIDLSATQPYMQMKKGMLEDKLTGSNASIELSEDEEEDNEHETKTTPINSHSPYIKTDNMLSMPLPMKSMPQREVKLDKADLLLGDRTPSGAPPDNLLSYCRIGWDNRKNDLDLISESLPGVSDDLSTTHSPNRTIGYVPHKHFENKMLKED